MEQQATPNNMGAIEAAWKGVTSGVKAIGKIGKEALFDDYTLGVQDKTSENLGTQLEQNLNEEPEWMKVLKMQWEREDEKQAHIEEREDTAYSRKIEDLRRSGVNINALGDISAAPTGGGITNATGPDYTMEEAKFNAEIEMLMQEIDLKFKGDQAEKDRIKEMIKSIITAGAILGGAGMKAAAK